MGFWQIYFALHGADGIADVITDNYTRIGTLFGATKQIGILHGATKQIGTLTGAN